MKLVEQSIIKLADLQLAQKHGLKAYIGKKNEICQIATAIDSLYCSLQEIVATLGRCSSSLSDSAVAMQDSTKLRMIWHD